MPDTSDVIERLSPFDIELRRVAQVLGKAEENLLYRASGLMSEVAPESEWSERAESAKRAILESADVQFAYRRPRTHVARQAMYRAVSELIDAGLVPRERTRLIWEMLRPHDRELVLPRPARRPLTCGPVEGLDQWHKPPADWLLPSRITSRRLARACGDRVVLGEVTRVCRLSWEHPEEVIRWGAARPAGFALDARQPFQEVTFPRLLHHYSERASVEEGEQILIRNTAYELDSAGHGWIALNPRLASRLGWRCAAGGICRWVDGDGRTTVETMWWADGTPDHHGHVDDDEAGEGWLVVCSETGLASIVGEFGPLDRVWQIARTRVRDGREDSGANLGIEKMSP